MKLLGIDYGKVYMGLATTEDELTPTVLKVVKSKSDTHKINEIAKICKEEGINKVVIGNGSGKLENHIRGFIDQLKKNLTAEVVSIDETLTSNQAVEKMIADGVPQKKRSELEHGYAAAILLSLYEYNK